MRQYRGTGTPGEPREGPGRPPRGSLLPRDEAGAAGRRQRGGSARPPPGRPRAKSERRQEPRERRLCGTCCPCPARPRSELGRPVPAANSPARPAAPGPAPPRNSCVPPGAAQARWRRAGRAERAELRPGTAGRARVSLGIRARCAGEPRLPQGCPVVRVEAGAGVLWLGVARLYQPDPPRRCGGARAGPGAAQHKEINIPARPKPGKTALSRTAERSLCVRQRGMVPCLGARPAPAEQRPLSPLESGSGSLCGGR